MKWFMKNGNFNGDFNLGWVFRVCPKDIPIDREIERVSVGYTFRVIKGYL